MALTVRTVFDGHVVLDIKSNYVNISEKDRCPGVDIDFFLAFEDRAPANGSRFLSWRGRESHYGVGVR